MKKQDVICGKIDDCVDDINKLIKTGTFDAVTFAKRLHAIRTDAQNMEDGLKLRKQIMEKNSLEDSYQRVKKKKSVPPGINKVFNREEGKTDKPLDFEFIVKEKGEIIYQNMVFAGVMVTVEKISDIDEKGFINGQTQKFFFGHDIAIWYAFDQLRQSIEGKMTQIALTMKHSIQNKVFADKNFKKKILNATNNKPE